MRVFGIAGRSGSGKTTLLVKLIPWFKAGGLSVSTLKQAKDSFDVDSPGKDSFRHREAGAREVLVASARRFALMHEYRDEEPFGFSDLVARMKPVDVLLVEGFRQWEHERLEVWRQECGSSPLWPDDPRVVAVATASELPHGAPPRLDPDDVEAIGRFILGRLGLGRS